MGWEVFVKHSSLLREQEYGEDNCSTGMPQHSHTFSHTDADVKQAGSRTEDKDLQETKSNTWSLEKSKATQEIPYKCVSTCYQQNLHMAAPFFQLIHQLVQKDCKLTSSRLAKFSPVLLPC